MSPAEVRRRIARGEITTPTADLCPGYVQANLVVLPKEAAFEFLLFCLRNPRPCPLLEVTEPGDPYTRVVAEGADLRTELPRYRVWQHGKVVAEPTDVTSWWTDDMVAFLLGCSFTFDGVLMQAGIGVRHVEMGRNVPMYRTKVEAAPAGRFRGPLVVSMRPVPRELVPKVVELSGRYPMAHGAPVHVGEPQAIGIRDINRPDYGEAVELRPGEEPVFWACGVTPQAAIEAAGLELAITHAPGHMFITDLKAEELDRKAFLSQVCMQLQHKEEVNEQG